MSNHIHEVVIAGGGLGGLTAAYLLRNVGMKVTVLEASSSLGEVGAGIQTAPNASRILINAGLRPQLEAIKTVPTSQVRRRWSDGKILASRPLGDSLWEEFGAPYWHFHRADLHQMLVDVCSDPTFPGPVVDLHTSSRVVDADNTDPARPVAVTSDGRRYSGDVLIGADGVHSKVRSAMGMSEDDLLFSGQMVFRAMVPGAALKADPATRFLWDDFQSTMWYGPGRHLVHYFIRGGDYLNVAAALASDVDLDKGWTQETTAEEFIKTFSDWDSRIASILEKAEGPVLKWALFAHRQNPVWVQDNIGLLGDAAHAMVPFQAQGASQAIEDASVLADELAVVNKNDISNALLRYGAKRAKRAGTIQEASAQNAHLYQLPDGPEQIKRDEKLVRFVGESDVSYEWLWNGKHEPMTTSYAFTKGGTPGFGQIAGQMIIPFHATLPVSGDQAINALADRHFISGCVDGIQLEHSVGDDLLRGTFTVGESDTTYQFGLRLVDFDADDHSLSYEASAREVDGRGLASLVIYLDIDDATSALVVTSRLEMAGMGAGAAYSNLEQAVADRLVAFATSVVAALGDDAGRLWRTPGASADQDPETPLTTAIPAKAALGPRLQRVLLPLGALGGTGVVAYLIWRVVRNDQAKGATS